MDSVRVSLPYEQILFKNAPRKANFSLVSLPLAEPVFEPSASPASPAPPSDESHNHGLGPDMCREEARLKTFDNWPLPFLQPETLARNGFYYLGRGDEVRCAFCKVEIMRWEEGDNPAKDHQLWAPQCPFLMNQAAAGNVPYEPATRRRVRMPSPVHPEYASEVALFRTFKDWSENMRQKYEEFAEADVFYTGHSEKTTCFCCDDGVKNWKSQDNNMAANKTRKKAAAVDLPDCPECRKVMSPPIFLCLSGHSLCSACTQALQPPTCPVCRQPMTHMRNQSLEELINKAKVPCPYRAAGCPLSPESAAVKQHVDECTFRSVPCPLTKVLGKCSWTGQSKQIMNHIKEKHPCVCDIGLNTELELDGVTLRECDRRIFVTAQHKLLFIIAFTIDMVKRMAYWTVQVVGSKALSKQYVCEIQVQSKRDPQRQVTFAEHCLNDAVKTDDIFLQSGCAVLPLEILAHFVKNQKMAFRYLIKKSTHHSSPREKHGEVNDNLRSVGGVPGS